MVSEVSIQSLDIVVLAYGSAVYHGRSTRGRAYLCNGSWEAKRSYQEPNIPFKGYSQ
jgi:hypothetical protein